MLVKRAPINPNAHRLAILDGYLYHGAKVVIIFAANAYIAGIDAVLSQRLRAFRVAGQQQMSVVMKVTDDGHANTAFFQSFHNGGNGFRGFVIIHGYPHQL